MFAPPRSRHGITIGGSDATAVGSHRGISRFDNVGKTGFAKIAVFG